MSRRPTDDSLRRVLRRGDPAGDGRDPGREELAAWRMRMAAAAAERRRPVLRPIWLAPAAAVALGIAMLLLFPRTPPPVTPRPDVTTAPVTATPVPPTGADLRPPGPAATAVGGHAPADTAPVATAPAPTSRPGALPAVARRTVQMTAPGGTRIIWTLDSRFQLNDQGGAS